MSYVKSNGTPLMFGGPTPVNMAPAMAGCCSPFGDDEVAPYVGTGPNIEMDPEPARLTNEATHAGTTVGPTWLDTIKSAFNEVVKGAATSPVNTGIVPPKPKSSLTPVIVIAGVGLGAYFLFKKRS
jgi:hypothetical protein